jgi:hypothetical protein
VEIFIYEAEAEGGGVTRYASFLRPDSLPKSGLPAEAIVGTVTTTGNEPISPGSFVPNPLFIRFLHYVIAKHGSRAPGFAEEAKRQWTGCLYLFDGRIVPPKHPVPIEEIIGLFDLQDGKAMTYQANPKHVLINDLGFFKLNPWLFDRLVEEALACG